MSERTTVTIGTLTELTPTPRFSCYVHALGSLTSSLHLRLLTSYGSSSSRSTSCGPQSFGLSAGSLSPFNVTTAVPLTHFSAVTLKSFNHQAVTKGLSSTSKFSGSCVPTLQTLPHFHLLPILWFPSFTSRLFQGFSFFLLSSTLTLDSLSGTAFHWFPCTALSFPNSWFVPRTHAPRL